MDGYSESSQYSKFMEGDKKLNMSKVEVKLKSTNVMSGFGMIVTVNDRSINTLLID